MRLAFLTHEPFYPPSGGGSAEALYLVEEFVRRGHEVHLFCPIFPDAQAVAVRFGVTLHLFERWEMGRYTAWRNLKYLGYPLALASLVRRVLSQARQAHGDAWRFDLLFAQHTISAVAAGSLRRQLKVPVVLNYLDFLTGFMETWPAIFNKSGLVPLLNRLELNLPRRSQVEGVLTVSQALANRLAAAGYPQERILPIQYGYDATLFIPASLPPSGPPVVVMHGSFDQHHLGPIAREAVSHVISRRPQVVFRFIGQETESLRRFAAEVRTHHPQARLESMGFVPYAEMARQLQAATLGIIPYEESRGTHCAFVATAAEYLGCGLPVVSTPLENLQAYFGSEEALRFSQFSGTSFADAILRWLDVPLAERQRCGRKASQRVAAELDWRIVARRAVKFAEQCAAANPSSRP